MNHKLSAISFVLALISLSPSQAAENKVPYPTDYRQWTHVKTMVIEPGHPLENPFQGIHHVYANEGALQGLKTGDYAQDSVLVFDLLETVQNDQTIQEGKRKLLGVMHKDAGKYRKTGGWGFEGFAANSKTERLTEDGGQSCFTCHTPQKNSDYVFSEPRN